jgi:hypothetical protein
MEIFYALGVRVVLTFDVVDSLAISTRFVVDRTLAQCECSPSGCPASLECDAFTPAYSRHQFLRAEDPARIAVHVYVVVFFGDG